MRIRFSTRLILSVVLIEAVMLSVLVWNSVRLISTSHAELLENSTRAETLLLANNLAPGLMANDVAMIRDSLSLLKDKRGLVYITVYDRSRQIMASRGQQPSTLVQDVTYEDARADGVFDVMQDIEVFGQHLGVLHAGYSIDTVRQLTEMTRRQNTTIAAIMLILSILATIFLGLVLTRDLRRLEDGAHRFGQGELDHRIALDSNNEIGDVARSFNDMAGRVAEDQRRLRDSENHLKKAQHVARMGDLDWNTVSNEVTWSEETCHIFGLPLDFKPTLESTLALVHPDDVVRVGAAITNAIRDRTDYNMEHRMVRTDGEVIYVHAKGELTVNEQDVVTRMLGTIVDITESKKAETELEQYREHLEELVEERTRALQNAQYELLKKERLATLGQLTATVSHELRNPLAAVRMSLYIIDRKIDKNDEGVQQAMERVDRNIDRCDHIVQELLDFTRISEPDRHAVRIDEWLETVIDEQIIPGGIQVERNLCLGNAELSIDADRMRRAVINVVENACHAMLEDELSGTAIKGSRLGITTRGNEERIEIVISDTGSGMGEDVLKRIFEPLFSTRTFGVGLGMASVKQTMEQHKGGIEIETQAGRGTSMTLWLPVDVAGSGGEEQAVRAI